MHVLCEEIDLRAPLPDVFATFLAQPYPVFLDSSKVDRRLGRYSYIAADPFLTISAKDGEITIASRGPKDRRISKHSGDPFAALRRALRPFRSQRIADLPPFQGGAIGYFGYDLGRYLEVLPNQTNDDVGLPDMSIGLYDWVLAHDHLQARTWLIAVAIDGDLACARQRLRAPRHVLSAATAKYGASTPSASARRIAHQTVGGNGVNGSATGKRTGTVSLSRSGAQSVDTVVLADNFTRADYLSAIAAAKDHIARGDIYEVCLSQRFTAPMAEHPWPLYERLRAASPVPYGAYLGLPDGAVVSASPELFLRLEGGRVETRPMKGTRPRGACAAEDAALAVELRSSEKEQAENVMIVDLLRNDLGRVCTTGTVHVPELFAIESYSTVHQMVSTITGELRPDFDAIDLLRASFPGGSVTGCPKIRAMEIIDALEPTRRGIYCGAIGCLGFDGELETSIVIRTIIVKDGLAHLQVGGAIVADSDPAAEYQETLDKAKAGLLALSSGGQPLPVESGCVQR